MTRDLTTDARSTGRPIRILDGHLVLRSPDLANFLLVSPAGVRARQRCASTVRTTVARIEDSRRTEAIASKT